MIRCDRANVKIRGHRVVIMSELSMIINALNKGLTKAIGADAARERIMHNVNIGLMTEEELDEELKEKLAEVPDVAEMIDDFMNKLLERMAK